MNDPLPNDHLDPLLRQWHDQNSHRATELRTSTLQRTSAGAVQASFPIRHWLRSGLAAAAVIGIAVLAAYFVPVGNTAYAEGGVVMVPEGGRLDALDRRGQVVGTCPLKHTDVHVDVAGPFTRVTLVQQFQNPYRVPIEAVYTFPLGERGAVDRMKMVVHGPSGDRTVVGQVKERSLARFIYEAARDQGYVASLLEQERPNIFTQSVANIEPGSTVDVEISYVETLAMKDGVYQFAFPMVVGPRYIPGRPSSTQPLPAGWQARDGVVLLGPAQLQGGEAPAAAAMLLRLQNAQPVQAPTPEQTAALGSPTASYQAVYADGSQEPCVLYATGAGSVGNRWFVLPSGSGPDGKGFAADTTQVPDASRITPMPTRPNERAGHDISVSVSIDAGGVPLRDLQSKLHGINVKWEGDSRCTLQLAGGATIPNKDFVLSWGLKGNAVMEGVFTDAEKGFLTLVMNPPAPDAGVAALPRELVFVVDTSGSMSGFPIEKSKELMRKALAAMRPEDSFNVVTFAGSTAVLWPELRPASKDNVDVALKFVDGAHAGGGTEMMKAIEAALVQMPRGPVTAPPNGSVTVPPRTPVNPGQPGSDDLAGKQPSRPPMRVAVFLTDGYVGNDQGIIAAVAKNAGTTRVFTFGIGNNVNRYLLEEMARQGRGACDIVLLADAADKAVELFNRRIQTPVLMDISVAFEGMEVTDLQPSGALLPDLFDVQPLVVHGRCAKATGGTIVVRGRTAKGPFERRIPVEMSSGGSGAGRKHDFLPQLWARAQVDAILAPHLQEVENQTLAANLRQEVVRLGETYQIVSPYTSFVAVEKSRVIVGGRAMQVTVPIEFPDGLRWEGFFGDSWCNQAVMAAARCAEQGVAFDSTSVDGAVTETLADNLAADTGSNTLHLSTAAGNKSDESRAYRWAASKEKNAGTGGTQFYAAKPAAAAPALRGVDPRPTGGMAGGGMGGGGGGFGAPAPAGGRTESEKLGRVLTVTSPGAPPPAGAVPVAPPTASSPPPPPPPPPPAPAVGSGAPAHDKKDRGGADEREVQSKELAKSAPLPAADAAAAPSGRDTQAAGAEAAPPSRVLPQEIRDRLATVLDRRLLALALYDRLTDAERAKLPPLPENIDMLGRSAAGQPRGPITVTVLLSADDAQVRAALTAAGFTSTSQPGTQKDRVFLVGTVQVKDLIALASVKDVLRVEPAEVTPDAAR
ncbi:MAG: VIT and VWA domain-containing protein [Phycisphaerales bacterium]